MSACQARERVLQRGLSSLLVLVLVLVLVLGVWPLAAWSQHIPDSPPPAGGASGAAWTLGAEPGAEPAGVWPVGWRVSVGDTGGLVRARVGESGWELISERASRVSADGETVWRFEGRVRLIAQGWVVRASALDVERGGERLVARDVEAEVGEARVSAREAVCEPLRGTMELVEIGVTLGTTREE